MKDELICYFGKSQEKMLNYVSHMVTMNHM